MPTVRYTGNANRYKLTGDGVTFEQGEDVSVSEDTAEYVLGLEDFEAAAEGPRYSIEAEDGDVLTASEATVDEVEAAIADVKDADALAYLLEAEREGPDRNTAKEAIQGRLDELED
jgi:hypothetical protein